MNRTFLKKYYPELIFALSLLLLLLRGMLSFCWSDETLYYSTAYRFLQGDAPFFHEWYPTQLLSILLLPFLAVFRLFSGSMDGVILYFRILTVLLSGASAYSVYRLLRERVVRLFAMLATLLLLFYTHLNIQSLSYYTVSVHCGVLIPLLLVRYSERKKDGKESNGDLIVAGVLMVVLVLSMPTMLLVYGICAAAALLFFHREGRKAYLMTLAGSVPAALIFTGYLLCRVSIPQILASLPYVLNDEEHSRTTLYVTARRCVTNLTEQYGRWLLVWVLAVLTAAVVRWLVKRGKVTNLAKATVLLLTTAVFTGMLVRSIPHTGYIQVVLVLTAVPVFLLTEKKDLGLLPGVLLGLLMAYSYTYTSSGSPLYTEAVGFAVASVPAVCFYAGFVREQGEAWKVLCLLQVCAAVLLTISLRIFNVYRDDRLMHLTARIEQGPAKGLYTSEAHLAAYDAAVESVRIAAETAEGCPQGKDSSLLISKLMPFGYLCTDLKCAAPSSWRNALDSPWLEQYYALYPERRPDLVLVLDASYGSYETVGDVVADPIPNENTMGDSMREYLNDGDFAVKEVPAGRLYYRK